MKLKVLNPNVHQQNQKVVHTKLELPHSRLTNTSKYINSTRLQKDSERGVFTHCKRVGPVSTCYAVTPRKHIALPTFTPTLRGQAETNSPLELVTKT